MQTYINPALPELLQEKIRAFIPAFDALPCVVIIHDLSNSSIVYMSQKGLDMLGVSMAEMISMSSQDYHDRHFNADDARDYVPKIMGLLERNNDDEMISHFQQVRFAGSNEWHWHLSSLKIFARDEDGSPRMAIATAVKVDAMHHMAAKAERILAENNFLRQNFQRYSELTKREREVLRLTVLGKSASEIAAELFIAATTVETHRRNVKLKLNANTYFELSQYAQAFDLI